MCDEWLTKKSFKIQLVQYTSVWREHYTKKFFNSNTSSSIFLNYAKKFEKSLNSIAKYNYIDDTHIHNHKCDRIWSLEDSIFLYLLC